MSVPHRRLQRAFFLAIVSLPALCGGRLHADALYTLTNLGQIQLPGTYSLNDSGEVVGNLANGSPFLYQSSGPAAGTFTNLSAAVGANTNLTGINDSGQIIGNQVVGYVPPREGAGGFVGNLTQAILYSGGQVTKIPMFPGDHYNSAVGINETGLIIGSSGGTASSNAGGNGYIYQNGRITNLGNNGPTAVSNSGLVTGGSGFLYQNGHTLTGLPSAAGPTPYAINNSGEVVGSFWAPNGHGYDSLHAFLYQNGHMNDLGALAGNASGVALGINSVGQVVGDYVSSSGPYGSLNRAFLYQNGALTDLNTVIPATSGWFLTGGVAINDRGQILATGVGPDGSWAGKQDVFLLTPIIAPSPVPEPGTLAFFGLIALGLGLRRVRQLRGSVGSEL